MATEIFPIYDILVNSVFGSVGLAIMGIGFVMMIILFLSKVSKEFIMVWMGFYLVVMGTYYVGALGMIFGFIVSVVYMFIAFIKWVSPER